MNFIKDHPTIGGAILSLIGAVLALFIHNPDLVAGLVGMAAVFAGLHQVVVPVTTAATQITQAATDAATKVASDLDKTVAGSVGEIIPAAQEVVDNAVTTVLSGILGKK